MSEAGDKVLERIRKLLALAGNNPSETEAAAAAEKVQSIMAEHNLTMADVKTVERDEDDLIIDSERKTTPQPWRRNIGTAISKMYFCSYFYTTTTKANGKTKIDVHNFVGKKSNIAVAKLMFEYLHTTVDRLAYAGCAGLPKKQHSPYRTSFRSACTNRLCSRIMGKIEEAKRGGLMIETADLKKPSGGGGGGMKQANTLPALLSTYDAAEKSTKAHIEKHVGELQTTGRNLAQPDLQGTLDGRAAGDRIGLGDQIEGKQKHKALPGQTKTRYDNTPQNAKKVGWLLVPEKCTGDVTAKYVTHDHVKGTFTFHDDEALAA